MNVCKSRSPATQNSIELISFEIGPNIYFKYYLQNRWIMIDRSMMNRFKIIWYHTFSPGEQPTWNL